MNYDVSPYAIEILTFVFPVICSDILSHLSGVPFGYWDSAHSNVFCCVCVHWSDIADVGPVAGVGPVAAALAAGGAGTRSIGREMSSVKVWPFLKATFSLTEPVRPGNSHHK